MPSSDLYQSVVITGGGGLLAGALARAMKSRGVAFAAVDHIACDIVRDQDRRRIFEQYRPSLLLNCAADTRVDRCQRRFQHAMAVNGRAVGALAELAAQYDTRFVHFSTDFVFDGQSGRPSRPNDLPHPLSVYGRSKLLGERLAARVTQLRWLIIRTAALFGPYGRCFPAAILDAARAGKPLAVVNDQITCPTYVDDLAEVTLQLVDREAQGIWHVAGSGPTSWFDFAHAVLREFAVNAEVTAVNTPEWRRLRPGQAPRPAYSVLDCSTLATRLGRTMRNWTDALRDYRSALACHN